MRKAIIRASVRFVVRAFRLFSRETRRRLLSAVMDVCLKEIFARNALLPAIAKIFEHLDHVQAIDLITCVNDLGQRKVDAYSSVPLGGNSGNISHPFPLELRRFESLYDSRSGNWQAPYPTVKLRVFDKRLYPRLMPDSIELETGHFLYCFVRMIAATNVLETGVSRGYSTCCIASALRQLGNDGHVYAIDAVQYPHLWEGTELAQYITFIRKPSQKSLPDVEGMEFDLLMMDSNHDYETCLWEVANFEKLLKPGGYILMHDSLHYDGVGAVVQQLQNNPRFETVTMPTPRGKADEKPRRSGLTIVRKTRNGDPPLTYDPQYEGWFWGDTSQPPFLWRTERL